MSEDKHRAAVISRGWCQVLHKQHCDHAVGSMHTINIVYMITTWVLL